MELEEYYFKEDAASREDLERYLVDKVFSEYSGIKVIAVYQHDIILGFATFAVLFPAPKLSGQMYMKDLFVSAQARGKGIGLKLIKALANIALQQGCSRLDWTAESTNPSAGHFYHAIGAAQIEEKQYFRLEGDQLIEFVDHY
tara:strand:- start:890 stop:1318 length:429 start_codon:yes stop_codon:yes gene_type:complete